MYCPHCGKEIPVGANFCSVCGKAPGFQRNPVQRGPIVRPRSPRVIAGVCSGFALHYGWDLVLTRILFTVVTVLTFPLCVVLYLVAWLILPDAQYALPQQVQ